MGGKVSYQTMGCMNMYGRVAVCGAISVYNDTADKRSLEPPLQPIVVGQQLRMEGFFVWRWLHDGESLPTSNKRERRYNKRFR